MLVCKICGNKENNHTFLVHEHMFGLKGEFEYFQCCNCKCIQLINIPPDLADYYPPNQYYSFNLKDNLVNPGSLESTIRKIQSDYLLFGKQKLFGSLLSLGTVHPYFSWLKKVQVDYGSSVLDVGCGNGDLLFRMRRHGFKNLSGVDPFIEKDIYAECVNIYKKEIYDLQGTYDFIMLNHSYEHMDQPLLVLKKLYELLKPCSYLLIRIPVSDSYCWKHYGTYWAALDAPRHLYIQSERSMEILGRGAGFQIEDIIHDGTAFQFWASEQYKRGINLVDDNSYSVNKSKSIFSKKQIREYKKKMRRLNSQHLGGKAQFYLYKQ
jgi:SAM-dependent methyltransferase